MPPDVPLPTPSLADLSIQRVPSLRWSENPSPASRSEEVVVESALSLEIVYERSGHRVVKALGITMRTPGQDDELACGFLLGEGVIRHSEDILMTEPSCTSSAGETIDTLRITLSTLPRNDLQRVSRATTTTSACGLCGRSSLEGLAEANAPSATEGSARISGDLITVLPEALRTHQSVFARTGGCHGAALATSEGKIILTREDVGRHNAVDKLFGAALMRGIALNELLLVLSGRASFELVQKSAAAGVPVIVAVGAPSSAAVALAHSTGITLIGFTREDRFNLYTHAVRVDMARLPVM